MDLQGDGVGCSSSPLPAPWVCSTAAAAGAGMGQQGMAQGAGCRCPVHPIARRRGWHGQAQRQRAAAARQRMRAWRCRRARSTARGACCRRCCHAPPQSAFVSVLTCVRVGKHAGLRRSCGERCTCKRHTGRRRGLVATWRCRARRMRMVARARGRAHTHPRARRVRTIVRHVVTVERTSLRSRTTHSKPRVFGTLATHVCGCVGAGSGTNAAARRCARQHRWCCHADVASATTRRHQR